MCGIWTTSVCLLCYGFGAVLEFGDSCSGSKAPEIRQRFAVFRLGLVSALSGLSARILALCQRVHAQSVSDGSSP